MPSLATAYFIVLTYLLILDGLFLTFVGGPWVFASQIVAVQRTPPALDWKAAGFCYLVMAALLVHFAFVDRGKLPATVDETFWFGAGIYAVFELTCKALFSQWEWRTVLVDTLWGGMLFATTHWASMKTMVALNLR